MRNLIFIIAVAALIITGCEQSSKDETTSSTTVTKPETVSGICRFAVDGKNLEAWNTQNNNTIAEHSQGLLITSAVVDALSGGTTQGVYTVLSTEYEKAFSGQHVIVTVVARQADENGTEKFAVAYSTNEVGNSGWRYFDAGNNFESYSFEYDVPVMNKGYSDFVGIWPDVSGSGKGLVVQSLTVMKLPNHLKK